VLGLQGSLDFENGGDLAKNLNELYAYVTRQLIFANAYNDLSVLKELYGLMSELRNAWQQVPALMRSRQAPALNGHQMLTAQV
jgi:flagellar protein FliS